MLIYRRTSILESPAQTLVNTVNCVGVMGKGLAHAFKDREPAMFNAYKRICDQKALVPGKLWLWRGQESWVLNFPTKLHWRNPSKLEWIEQGLEKFVSAYVEQGITEISFPQLGCGNGTLNWEDVRPLMEHYLSAVNIPVYVHDYTVEVGLPEHLEPVAAALRKDAPGGSNSFDGFIESIGHALAVSGGKLSTLGSDDPFAAHVHEGRGLAIETSSATCFFEEDDLRGVWLDLQSGLVTKRKAGWSVRGGGEPLLSLLSVLPHVRPVQIQRPGEKEPEFAIEPRPETRGLASTGQTKEQHELAWH
ncbi:phosphatase [Sphingobium sp. SCG-1]|uniref:macro domain-containing protein n=1 Tax=Sphingobium sp. SCG-1 TaxID=2072936 RepID=UPI000CD69754|nr:macro domain-containing protein [Sphingobium sp. SCG-1]AUW57079.1 phosphatase [Sphingobium sp. SCG-1]